MKTQTSLEYFIIKIDLKVNYIYKTNKYLVVEIVDEPFVKFKSWDDTS